MQGVYLFQHFSRKIYFYNAKTDVYLFYTFDDTCLPKYFVS